MNENKQGNNPRTGLEVAVIGMAGRFPGAQNIDEFWENLKNGKETISRFSDEELLEAGVDPEKSNNPNYVKAKGIIDEIEYFDEYFFNYTPVEAEVMDPQMRIFHECVWQGLEDAGYDPFSYDGAIGLYAGASSNWDWEGLSRYSNALSKVGFMGVKTLSDKDFLSTMVSYKLNLKGPSITLYTACSTSLVAVDMAYRTLLTGECDMAVAGGITVSTGGKTGYLYQEGMIHSKEGRCRAFDARADGTIFGNGVGIVVFRRLNEALVDRDNIYAVILSSVVNNDGERKIGYTAPSVEGQAEAIRTAHFLSGIDSETIRYIEAHGTGTILGDPIEIDGLKMAFNTEKKNFCRIGSVKTNVGHLDIAAGVTGLIKAVLSLKYRLIPPSLNFETPNPKIDFENSPFIVNNKLTEWKNETYPLRAGVNSFGIGGTNAHVVLEESPVIEVSEELKPWKLLLLSANTENSLEELTQRFAQFLKKNPNINLSDAAYTLQVGRRAFKYRRMVICSDVNDAAAALSDDNSERIVSFHVSSKKNTIIFMFPGQGSQYVNMGMEMYQTEPIFRQEIDRCFEILQPIVGYDMKTILYPESNLEEEKVKINETEITQPLLFIFEYALAQLLMKWGIKPEAMVGHSIGEYVAACLAGVFTLEDALSLVVLRGKLMQDMPGGAMLSVPLSEDELKPLLSDDISLAAVNTPSLCTVSGSYEAIAKLEKLLEEKGHDFRRLHTSHAFHSRMMEPILKKFAEKVNQVKRNKPGLPFLSNVTGKWITEQEVTDPGYWARQIREPVRFSDSVRGLITKENSIFVEVGPGQVLSTFVTQHPINDKPSRPLVLNLVRHPKKEVSDVYFLLDKIGHFWLYGNRIDWDGYYSREKRQRISLPTYPFKKQYYETRMNPVKDAIEKISRMSENTRKEMKEWFYIPSWKQTMLPVTDENLEFYCYVLFMDELGIGTMLLKQLERCGHDVVIVKKGKQFSRESVQEFIIDPLNSDDYKLLIEELDSDERKPKSIVHLWTLSTRKDNSPGLKQEEIERIKECGFYSLLNLAQSLGTTNLAEKLKIVVVTNRMWDVMGETRIFPEKAILTGPVKVIPKEYPDISCCCIDIVVPDREMKDDDEPIGQLYTEITAETTDGIVVYRNHFRWLQIFEPVRWDKLNGRNARLKREGVYLITGGLGGIGLTLAKYLASKVRSRLVLTARSPLLSRDKWREWLETHDEDDEMSLKVRGVQELEEMGAEVMIINADVCDHEQMKTAVIQAKERFGAINGVIHAAGLADGGMIQRRTREISENVFAPKVQGTLVLDRVLKDETLDFFVLCSSIFSILGPLGEVAYTSANAFMDAFARQKVRTKKNSTFTVSINWDGWQEVGMVVNMAKKSIPASKGTKSQTRKVSHPLLEKYTETHSGHGIYFSTFEVSKYWVLNEHRIMGNAVLVGTAYLEMARAAYEKRCEDEQAVELRDVYFLNPLVVGEKNSMRCRLILKKRDENFEFFLMSQTDSGDDKWKGHARGELARVEAATVKKHNIEEIKSLCNEKRFIISREDFKPSGGLVEFSQRWNSIREIYFGKNQGLAKIELLDEYADEIDTYALHPALLDNATSFMIKYARKSKDSYLPFAYKKLRMRNPLPQKVYSYIRYLEDRETQEGIMKFDITIMDEQGRGLVDIEEFTVLTVSGKGQLIADNARKMYPLSSFLETIDVNDHPGLNGENIDKTNTSLKDVFKVGILPGEGVEVFSRILSRGTMPQVAVSTRNLMKRMDTHKKAFRLSGTLKTKKENHISGVKRERGELDTEYTAPTNDAEQMLAVILQDNLGIEKVGINDDFFKMGGDSLKAIKVTSRIKEEFNVDVQIAEIFNTPTIKGLAKCISNKLGKKEEEKEYIKLEPGEKKEFYPLSMAQKGIYFQHQMNKDSLIYNEAIRFEFNFLFSPKIIANILNKIIKRHEILRTSFQLIAGEPKQIVHENVEGQVEYFERSNESELNELIEEFIQPFDLTAPPLLRVALINLSGKKSVILIDAHHIIADAYSIELFTIDLEVMRQMKGDKESPGKKLQYKDYAEWLSRPQKQKLLKMQGEYWINQFRGEIPVLNLPTDYKRPQVRAYVGDSITFELSRNESEALKKLALEQGLTLFMILFSLYSLLISKLSGHEDIIVGIPISIRTQEEMFGIMGIFVNVLPLRSYPRADMTFIDFLKQVKESTLMAFKNKEYHFGDIVDKLAVKRDPGRHPLFDIGFALENVEMSSMGEDQEPYGTENRRSKLDLVLLAVEMKKKLFFRFQFNTTLYKKETVIRFERYFRDIVTYVLENNQDDIKLKDIQITHDLSVVKAEIPQMEFQF